MVLCSLVVNYVENLIGVFIVSSTSSLGGEPSRLCGLFHKVANHLGF